MTTITQQVTSSSLLDLRCYPPEILGTTILANYCNAKDIWNLWCAILGNEEHVKLLWPLLIHNYTHVKLNSLLRRTRRRIPDCLQTLIHDELSLNHNLLPLVDVPNDSSITTLLDQRNYQSRRLLQRLHLLEYFQGPSSAVLWAGRMEFSIPRDMRFFQPERLTASVKLCCYGKSFDIKDSMGSDAGGCDKEMNGWSFCNLRAWKQSFPEWLSVIQLRSQLYNFVPIPPYGRLQGICLQDKVVVGKIRAALEESDQVMTLIVRNHNSLILRIISPNQAKRRLEAFPSLANKFEQLAATEGLLCCWERTERWEDEFKLGYVSHDEKMEAIASILKQYQSCRQQNDPNEV